MSNKLVNQVKNLDAELSLTSKSVLWALADRCNDKTLRCDPSHERIAKDIGCSRRTVINHQKILAEKGLISVKKRKGGHTSNTYLFHLDKFNNEKTDETDVNEVHTSSSKTDVNEIPTDVNEVHMRCEYGSNRCERDSQETKETNLNQKKPTNESQFNDQSDFEMWWCVYPKESDKSMSSRQSSQFGNKQKSAKEWTLLKPNVDQLIADVEKRKASDRGWLAGYAPNPENYLKNEVWKEPIQTDSKSEDKPYNSPPRDDNQLVAWAFAKDLSPPPAGMSYYDYRQLLIREQKSNLEQFNNSFKEDLTGESIPAPVDVPTPSKAKTNGSTNAGMPTPVDGPFNVEQMMKNMAARKSVGR